MNKWNNQWMFPSLKTNNKKKRVHKRVKESKGYTSNSEKFILRLFLDFGNLTNQP